MLYTTIDLMLRRMKFYLKAIKSISQKILVLGAVAFSTSLLAQTEDFSLTEAEGSLTTEAEGSSSLSDTEKICTYSTASSEWIDRMRSGTHSRICNTVSWVDSLFGDDHKFDDKNFTGKVSLGFRLDEDEGFRPKLRIKLNTRLPNVSNKYNAFISRVEEDGFISDTETDSDSVSEAGLRSNNDDTAEWLIGLGYRDPNNVDSGFDVSIGTRVSSGLQPYAKLKHRYLFVPSQKNVWRTTQTVFWQRDDRFGASSTLDYTYLYSDKNIFEWDSRIKYTEDADETEWVTSGTWHHSFTTKKGISSQIYTRGEFENPITVPEFGATFTYITPFLRPWFFIETGIEFRWEREFPAQEYQSITRLSLQFQMLLGDFYANN